MSFASRIGRRTESGALVVNAIASRRGTLVYASAVEFYDPAKDAGLSTLDGVPVHIGHPGMAGFVGNVGSASAPRLDDAGRVHVRLHITFLAAIGQVQGGDLAELSAGYRADIARTPGVTPDGHHFDAVQVRRTYDHIALLPPGGARCGPTCSVRGDALDTTKGMIMQEKKTCTCGALESHAHLDVNDLMQGAELDEDTLEALRRVEREDAKADARRRGFRHFNEGDNS